MKAIVLVLTAIACASVAALGQGQFAFNNQVPPEINARFIANTDPENGSSSSIGGAEFLVQLFNVEAGGILLPLEPFSTTFRGPAGSSVAGYVDPTTETVPGVPPGAMANIVVRVLGQGSVAGQQDFGPYSVSLGGDTITPPNLPLGTSPLVIYFNVPEPTTLILSLVGIGALSLGRVLRAGKGPWETCS
jgi:hypothetical protein